MIWKQNYSYFKYKNCFHSNSQRLQFPWKNNAFREMPHYVQLLQGWFRPYDSCRLRNVMCVRRCHAVLARQHLPPCLSDRLVPINCLLLLWLSAGWTMATVHQLVFQPISAIDFSRFRMQSMAHIPSPSFRPRECCTLSALPAALQLDMSLSVFISYMAENIFDDICHNACNSRDGAFAAFFEFVPYKWHSSPSPSPSPFISFTHSFIHCLWVLERIVFKVAEQTYRMLHSEWCPL